MNSIDTLIATAQQQTGLSDFGDPSFREGLSVLVEALNREAKLTESGDARVEANIIATLSQRLRV